MLPCQLGWFPSCFLMFFPRISCLPNAVKIGMLQQLLTCLPLCRVHMKAALRKEQIKNHTEHLIKPSAQFHPLTTTNNYSHRYMP